MGDAERVDYETLLVEKHESERVAVVTLNRPDKLNAGSPTLFHELGQVMQGFDDDDSVQAIVLTGGDSKAFSAGADLGGMTFDNMGNCYWFIRRCNEAFESIEALPKIVIAAVNGYAFGFGLEITLACDLVIASDRARFGLRGNEPRTYSGGNADQGSRHHWAPQDRLAGLHVRRFDGRRGSRLWLREQGPPPRGTASLCNGAGRANGEATTSRRSSYETPAQPERRRRLSRLRKRHAGPLRHRGRRGRSGGVRAASRPRLQRLLSGLRAARVWLIALQCCWRTL